MKQFIRNILSYTVTVFMVGCTVIYLCTQFKPNQFLGNHAEYFMWNYLKSKISHKDSTHKNIIVGDSRCLASLNPSIIKHNFVNFSIGGGTAFEGYLTLKNYLKLNHVDTLIVSYCPYRFLGHDDCFENQTLAFNFASFNDVDNLEKVEKKYHRTIDNKTPSIYLDFYRTLLQIHFPLIFRSTFLNNIDFKDGDGIKRIKKELDETGHSFYGRSDSCNQPGFEVTRKGVDIDIYNTINPVCLAYLDSIYALARSNNIKVIFVTTPINSATHQIVASTNFYVSFKEFIKSFKNRYPQTIILSKFPFLPNNYFGDPNHVNKKGADFFSNYVHNELDTIKNYN